ncbi:SRPBCC domain-containing protein [Streptomyces sp. WM6378]|uniref:SRPBCC domain-containing protein n=1 Tax=Streptomyces sp. WM6378 TaxID=1415557 RepID=UPI0006B00153|nr:SRPBCC domain-containing protein [Streptomyces sp. WM6378]KOU43909.1 carbon monoxide dehydrogenase [Streptomyces sp. WM6378]
MEHEVFVPVEAQSLRQTLRDPARVARCVPGLQQDAGEPPIAGRLKVRLGGSTITYRGALRITEQNGGVFAFEGEGVEVRGAGAAKLTLTVRLEPAPGGTTLAFAGTALAEGRATDVPADAAQASALRLLDRFAAELARPVREEPGRAAGGAAEVADTDLNTDLADGPKDRAAPLDPELDTDLNTDLDSESLASVFDAEVPPPALDPLADEEFAIEVGEPVPAEAAHARRTMIGRSAEEVDHAPPRGRYAPVPAPSGGNAGATLRWVAPAAALALASAVVVGRALRRRR